MMNMDEVLAFVADVPDYPDFFTVDELNERTRRLAAKYPGVVDLIPLGHSRRGDAVEAIKIGDGGRKAVWFAMPHPNEPIGSMLLEFLSTRLAEDAALRRKLDTTWYLVKCIDMDSARLNEGWFKAPFSMKNYARHYYRPPFHLQVEWSFPVDYKTLHFDQPLPETQALMKLIETVRPDCIYSLHNSGFGGTYLYISHEQESFYPEYYRLAESQGIPLHLGEPETPYIQKCADAVFKMTGVVDKYEFLAKNTGKDPALSMNLGCSSYEYARRFGDPRFLVCELPYFYSPAIRDNAASDLPRREAVLANLAITNENDAFLDAQFEAIQGQLTHPNPFKDTVLASRASAALGNAARENWIRNDPSLEGLATVAEKFDNIALGKFYNLLDLGIFMRMLESEIQQGAATPSLLAALATVREEFERRGDEMEKDIPYEVIPIQKLVRVQLGAGLLYLLGAPNSGNS